MSTIPLLPPPVKLVRDAARSAGRLIRKGVQRITEKTLGLVLDLPAFTATHFELEKRGEQDILHRNRICAVGYHCGSSSYTDNGLLSKCRGLSG